MAAPLILVEATPRRANDGSEVAVRLAGGGGAKPYFYTGQHWKGGIETLPTIVSSIDFEEKDFGTGGVPSAAAIEWRAGSTADLADLAGYVWHQAAITVRIGSEGALPPIVLAGKALAATSADGKLTIALADPAADLKKPLLTERYGGTGDLDGPAEWEGRIKSRIWGRVWNVPGEAIDKANNIYCFADPLRPSQAFDQLRDRGAATASLNVLAWQGSAAETLTALRAAVAPEGGGVAAPSINCVKWWTQPGQLNADMRGEIGAGYIETTASIVERIVAAAGGPAFAAGTIAAANVLRPAPVGWHVDNDSLTVEQALDALLGNVSLLWLLETAGTIVIREWAWGAPVAAAKAISVKRTKTFRPMATRTIGYKRNELPMARSSLAAIVLYSDVAGLGELATADTAQLGVNITDESGELLTDVDVVTLEGTAAAITSQGALATKNAVDLGTSEVLNKSLLNVDAAANTKLGGIATGATVGARAGTNLYRSDGSTVLAQAEVRTIEGVAASITAQGALATKSSVDLATAEVLNKSLANVDAIASTKLATIDEGARRDGNMIPNGDLANASSEMFLFQTRVSRVAGVATDPVASFLRFEAGGNAQMFFGVGVLSNAGSSVATVPVSPGDRLFLRTLQRRNSGTASSIRFNFYVYDAAKTYGGTSNAPASGYLENSANGVWQETLSTFTVPATGSNGNPIAYIKLAMQKIGSTNEVDVAAVWVTKVERAATIGARAGTNLYQSNGTTVLTQADVRTIEGISLSITGQGALATKNAVDLGTGEVLNKSLANVDSAANTKLGGIAAGATVGARAGTNLYRTDGSTVMSQAEVRTAEGVALSFTGQGALATKNAVDLGTSEVLNKSLANVDATANTKLGGIAAGATVGARAGTNLFRSDGSTVLSQAEVRTAEGIALSITGQGALATQNTLAFGDAYLTGFGALAAKSSVAYGTGDVSGFGALAALAQVNLGASGRVYRDDGTTRLTDALAVTSIGTAAAIAGQGAWATYSTIAPATMANRTQNLDNSTGAFSSLANITTRNLSQLNGRAWTNLFRANGSTAISDADAITSLGIAASVAGQGSGATANNLSQLNTTEGTKLAGVEALADVTKATSGPAEIIVNYASNGDLTSALPIAATFKLTPTGGAAYTSGVTWSVTVESGSFTGTAPSISGGGSGQLLINSGLSSPEALLKITATYGGKAYPPVSCKVRKVTAAATGGGGGGGGVTFDSDNNLGSVTNTSWVAVSDDLTVTPTGATVDLTAANIVLFAGFGASAAESWNVEFKWVRENGATDVDIGSVANSNPDPRFVDEGGFYDPQSGEITCNRQATGLTASVPVTFRLLGRLTSGTWEIACGGEASAQG